MSKRKREMAIARKEFNKRREDVISLGARMRKMHLRSNYIIGVDISEPGKESLQVATVLDHLGGNR